MNKIIDIKFSSPGSEPFTVDEAKEDLKIDFTDDDTVLTRLIKASRKAVENYCSVSLIARTVTLTIDFEEEFELPYGPIGTITSVKIRTGTDGSGTPEYETLTADDYTTDGESYKVFNSSRIGRHLIVYATTAETSEDLVLAVKNELAYRYEHKGDQTQQVTAEKMGVCEAARELANEYVRKCWI